MPEQQTSSAISFRPGLPRDYWQADLAPWYSGFLHRLLAHLLLAALFLCAAFAGLALHRGPGFLPAHLAFSSVYALNLTLVFAASHFAMDSLYGALALKWGGRGSRSVGRQWLVWGGGFLLGFLLYRTLLHQQVALYAPRLVEYYRHNPASQPGHLSVFLFFLPFWLAACGLTMQTILLSKKKLDIAEKQRLKEALGRNTPEPGPAGMTALSAPKPLHGAPRVDGFLTLPGDSAIGRLPVKQISHVSVEDHYCRIFFRDEGKEANLMLRMPLKDLRRKLPPDRFAHIHRSHLVNLDQVAGVKKNGATTHLVIRGNGISLPVSRRRLARLAPLLEAMPRC